MVLAEQIASYKEVFLEACKQVYTCCIVCVFVCVCVKSNMFIYHPYSVRTWFVITNKIELIHDVVSMHILICVYIL